MGAHIQPPILVWTLAHPAVYTRGVDAAVVTCADRSQGIPAPRLAYSLSLLAILVVQHAGLPPSARMLNLVGYRAIWYSIEERRSQGEQGLRRRLSTLTHIMGFLPG